MNRLVSLAILATATSCIAADDPAGEQHQDQTACATYGTSYSAYWKTCRMSGTTSALRDGEIVFTIDDGIGPASVPMAEVLAARGVTATFFPGARSLGSSVRLDDMDYAAIGAMTPAEGSLEVHDVAVARLAGVVDLGHRIGNHTYSHPIGGYPPYNLSFAALGDALQRAEVVDAHRLIEAALERAAEDHGSVAAPASQLRFFRPPGNSWSERAAKVLSVEPLAEYRGPIAWDVPAAGDEDFRCWSEGHTTAECGQAYLDAFRALPSGRQAAIVLLHDRTESVALAEYLMDRLTEISADGGTKAGNCLRFVPLRCSVGCTRELLPEAQQRCIHE